MYYHSFDKRDIEEVSLDVLLVIGLGALLKISILASKESVENIQR